MQTILYLYILNFEPKLRTIRLIEENKYNKTNLWFYIY